MTWTRAARWTTASTPPRASVQSVPPFTEVIRTVSAAGGMVVAEELDRVAARTEKPYCSRCLQRARPMNPLAPVTRIFIFRIYDLLVRDAFATQDSYCGHHQNL